MALAGRKKVVEPPKGRNRTTTFFGLDFSGLPATQSKLHIGIKLTTVFGTLIFSKICTVMFGVSGLLLD